jgi:tRNA A37 threonylcarbamoyltransferase TsaD
LSEKRQLDVGKIIYPAQFVYCTDNAAMIGAAGLLDFVFQSDHERT